MAHPHLSEKKSLFHVFREVGEVHVALTSQRVVHSEGCCQTMAGVTACAQLQVFAQQRLVVGMSTVLDDELCTLHRALAAQVGDTLFRYDDVRPPFAVDGQVKIER